MEERRQKVMERKGDKNRKTSEERMHISRSKDFLCLGESAL